MRIRSSGLTPGSIRSLAALLGLGLVLLGSAARSETEPAEPPPTQDEVSAVASIEAELNSIREIRKELAEKIAALRELAADDAVGDALPLEIELLASIDRNRARQIEALERRLQIEKASGTIQTRLLGGPRSQIKQDPPYILGILDALSEAIDSHAVQNGALESAIAAGEEEMRRAEARVADREPERRLAAEALEDAKDEAEAVVLGEQLRIARLESQRAIVKRDLARIQLRNLERDHKNLELTGSILSQAADWVRANLELSREDLRAPLERVATEAQQLERKLEATADELEEVERGLDRATDKLTASDDPSAVLVAEVEARRAHRKLLRARSTDLSDRIQNQEYVRELWDWRYRNLAGEASREELDEWQTWIEQKMEERDRTRRLSRAHLLQLQSELEGAKARSRESNTAARPTARWERARVRHLEELVSIYEAAVAVNRHRTTLVERTLREIREKTENLTLLDRVLAFQRKLQANLDFELFNVEDRSITVRKVLSAAGLLVVGYFVVVLLSRLLGFLLRRRGSLDRGAVAAIQGLAFYTLLVFVILGALRSANIPLAAFTVLGGALAIGVGFGSQNLVNNFMSGIILLAERPIKVGDVIDIESTIGVIERIGLRSTRVRTFENVHIVVPNSVFLENNVVNWTLSNVDVRTHVDVGVAYGSPTREVEAHLASVLGEHDGILNVPEPAIWFLEFGDSSLVFRANFWIRGRNMSERRRIESDVRHRIDEVFREAGITIAFPQRDVHLDTSRPLRMEMVSRGSSEGAGPEPD